MFIEQPVKRDVIKEDNGGPVWVTGDHIGLRGEEKETSEGVYEEKEEYNMSYSTVTQTAM